MPELPPVVEKMSPPTFSQNMSFHTPTIGFITVNATDYFGKIESISLDGTDLTEGIDYDVDDRGVQIFFLLKGDTVFNKLSEAGDHTVTIKANEYRDATVNVVADWE